MKRFLAATDGSKDGEHAVTLACALAQRANGAFARLEVEPSASPWMPQLEWWAEPATPGGTVTRLRGLPGVEIVRQAEQWSADLVVLGRHDRTTDGPFAIGATSDTVIRRRSGPSLFAPADSSCFNRALIALDGSLRGLGVLAAAVALLQVARASATAICVLGDPAVDLEEPDRTDPRIERILASLARVRWVGGSCDLMVRRGDPVANILQEIEATGSDLLVLGVRRGGAPGDLGSGHIGRDLLQTAPCAVLTVPI